MTKVIDAPRLRDYPATLPPDAVDGEERRVTTSGASIAGIGPDAPPLVSIVTVVFNNAQHIERAMESVFAQTYPNIEYIVIDGGSTDGTADIIRRHAGKLSYWHSKRDKGISDAFNTGVAVSRGTYVGIVNSDDWMAPEQVATAVAILEETGAPFVFGDLVYHHPDGAPAYGIAGDPNYADKLWHRMPQVNHPTAVVCRQIYAEHGGFDPAWKIGMDYDWLCRLKDKDVIGVHSATITGHMSLAGVSDRAWRECLGEHAAIATRHGSSNLIIWPLFALRKFKISIRIALARVLGPRMMDRIRQRVNRSYSRAAK